MYSCNVLDEQYAGAMAEHGFVPEPDNRRYGSMGLCWRQAGPGGSGYFWTYGQQDLYMLKIHDFYFHEDQLLEFCWPESLSVTWYESISGEEFSPCRRLVSGCVKSFIGGREPYRALIHRRVPIVSIGIEITPAYYQDYLRRQFPEEFQSLLESFQSLDQTDHFPEMVRLLKEVRDYRGEGLAAKLFYDGKVAEAVALVVERHRAHPAPRRTLTQEDERMLADVAAYITAHCADRLPLERLARIGCMGVSKLKDAFHAPIRLHHHSVYSGAADGACGAAAGKYRPARGPDRSNCGLSESQPFRAALPPQHRAEPAAFPGVLPPTGSRVREHAGPKKPGGRKKDSRQLSACS